MHVYPNYYKKISSHKYKKKLFVKYKNDKFIIKWIKTDSTI